jgi:hypothetical protein
MRSRSHFFSFITSKTENCGAADSCYKSDAILINLLAEMLGLRAGTFFSQLDHHHKETLTMTAIAMGKTVQKSEEENATTIGTKQNTRSAAPWKKKELKANSATITMPLSKISRNTLKTSSSSSSSTSPVLIKEVNYDQEGGVVVPPAFLENLSSWDQWLCRPIHAAPSDANFVIQQVIEKGGTSKNKTHFVCSLCGCKWSAAALSKKHLQGVRHQKTYQLYQALYQLHEQDAAKCATLLHKIREQHDAIESLLGGSTRSEAQRRDVLNRFVRGVHQEKKTVEQSWKGVEKRILAYKKQQQQQAITTRGTTTSATTHTEEESTTTMHCRPTTSDDSTPSASMSTGLVLADRSETIARNAIVVDNSTPTENENEAEVMFLASDPDDKPAEVLDTSRNLPPTKAESHVADVMDRLNDESAPQLALQNVSADYYSDEDAIDSPPAAKIPGEIETFGETTTTMLFSPFTPPTPSDDDNVDPASSLDAVNTCCNLSRFSELSMKSEVNWMDTIPEFEGKMQEADFLFSPVKAMNKDNKDLAILAYNAVNHSTKGSNSNIGNKNADIRGPMLQETHSLVSLTKAAVDELSATSNVCDLGEQQEVDPYSAAEDVTNSVSDVEDEIKRNVVAEDMHFNIIEALDEIQPTSVLDTSSSNKHSELHWLDEDGDLDRAKECVAALAFFGI